jgi:hypothetical protein
MEGFFACDGAFVVELAEGRAADAVVVRAVGRVEEANDVRGADRVVVDSAARVVVNGRLDVVVVPLAGVMVDLRSEAVLEGDARVAVVESVLRRVLVAAAPGRLFSDSFPEAAE